MFDAFLYACSAGTASLTIPNVADEQMERMPDGPEGESPYEALLMRSATMSGRTGAPPEGPVDIAVCGNRIAAIVRGGGPRVEAHRTIDASGMFVLPGFVDAHRHNGDPAKAPQPS